MQLEVNFFSRNRNGPAYLEISDDEVGITSLLLAAFADATKKAAA